MWLLPLVVPVVWVVMEIVSGSCLSMAFGVLAINSLIGALVPVGYLLGWLTSREREDRTVFLIALAVYFAFFTIAMVTQNIVNVGFWRADWIATLCALLSCGAILAAFAIALIRRKGLILRAVAHRTPIPQVQSPAIPSQRPASSVQNQNPPRQTLASTIGATRQDAPYRDPQPAPEAQPAPFAADPTPAVQPRATATGTATAPAPTPAPATVPVPAPHTIDANSCTATELLALSGMNASIARAIVSEREQNGPYQSLEDLITRNGLKPHVVAAFIGSIRVSAPSAAHPGSQHVRMLDL